jgi:hypothetical protein
VFYLQNMFIHNFCIKCPHFEFASLLNRRRLCYLWL